MAKDTGLRRQKIFDDALVAATAIAREEGLAGLTARRIAGEIGCSVGTLYNVFDNLDTLILYLNGTTLDALYDRLREVAPGDDPQSSVSAITETYHRFVRDDAKLWNVIFDHVWPGDYPIPDWYFAKIERLLEPLAEALSPLFPPGSDREKHQAAVVLWSGLHGIASLAAAGKLGIVTSDTASILTTMLVTNFVAGLESRQAAGGADST
jgi:AcrR family transcriptional regulator